MIGPAPEKQVHRGFGCKLRVTLSQGEMTRDAVEWCQGTAVGGGCSTRAWTRRERQRDGSAAGGHENFWGDTYPAILVPSPAPTSCRKRTGAGLHEHPMRDLAKPGPARRPGAFPKRFARGDGSRDRASDGAGMVGCGALRRERCSRKNADGPLPGLLRLPFPTSPGKLGAPCPCRRAGHGVAHGEPATASRHAWRATKSAMNLLFTDPV